RSARPGSPANSSRRWTSLTWSKWAARACHSSVPVMSTGAAVVMSRAWHTAPRRRRGRSVTAPVTAPVTGSVVVVCATGRLLQPVAELSADPLDVTGGPLEEPGEPLGVVGDGGVELGRRCRLLAAARVLAAPDAVVVAGLHPLHQLVDPPDGEG